MKRVVYGGGNYSGLYHGLSLAQLVTVINSNTLASRHHPAVCMTRSPRFAKEFLNSQKPRNISKIRCVLVLDKEAMSSNYKIEPVSDYMNMLDIPGKDELEYDEYAKSVKKRISARYRGDEFNKAEERCYTPIKAVSKYIKKILISNHITSFDEGNKILQDIEAEGFTVELF